MVGKCHAGRAPARAATDDNVGYTAVLGQKLFKARKIAPKPYLQVAVGHSYKRQPRLKTAEKSQSLFEKGRSSAAALPCSSRRRV